MGNLIKKKKRGFTLIEVLVSIAIFSIMSIPVSMMVISGVKNSKSGEYKQKAAAISQQIIEELKSNNAVSASNSNKIELRSGSLDAVPATTGHNIRFSKTNINVDTKNSLTADVTFERRNLEYNNRSIENTVAYDLTIEMNKDTINVIKADKSHKLIPIVIGSDFEIINNPNNGDNDNIKLVWKNRNDLTEIGSYKRISDSSGITNSGKIKIVSGDNTDNIFLENNLTNPLQIYVFSGNDSKVNNFTYSNGLVQLYEDNLNPPTGEDLNNNGVYDITVKIYKNENSSNEVKVYEVSTALSLVR
ncbi:prepilin-type N-terminal cleavage/methylation domain-containing protein [Clostridium frigoris]|uniref:Prepilin-type N-terminal cleavage/methylation domain-containing protein n=1 Tax=Clostridium frigoris TaxID=205327 RepID=A0ABS6BWF4_9CLOT|nr:prepilin-type N-terminal cleavage/methylation domain-containing protein [Clostridium frigoris]MBU3160434.1 prepilin-type N-terminal cleavage/methylation domain-containing protein [Clostridium frigoris]